MACSARRVADSAILAGALTDGGAVRGRQRLDDGAPNELRRTVEHFGGLVFPLLLIMETERAAHPAPVFSWAGGRNERDPT